MFLAAAFTIYMSGLMVHVGDDNDTDGKEKEFVAIVHDGGHIPLVFIDGKHLSSPTTDAFLQALRPGDRITLNLPGGDAKTMPGFAPGVPGLHLVGGDLDSEIQEGNDDIRVSYLDYPKGELSIHEWHKEEAQFVYNNAVIDHQCVPRVVRFKADTNQAVVTLRIKHLAGPDTVVELKPDAEMRLANVALPKDETDAASHKKSHFAGYGKLSKSAQGIADVHAGATCTPPPRAGSARTPVMAASPMNRAVFIEMLIGDQPECTNTDWP